jgi:hypothetical protein
MTGRSGHAPAPNPDDRNEPITEHRTNDADRPRALQSGSSLRHAVFGGMRPFAAGVPTCGSFAQSSSRPSVAVVAHRDRVLLVDR